MAEITKTPVHIRMDDRWVKIGEAEVIFDAGIVSKVVSFTPIVPYTKPEAMIVDRD